MTTGGRSSRRRRRPRSSPPTCWKRDPNPHKQPVFAKPGKYRLVVSKALETEDPILDGWCEITVTR